MTQETGLRRGRASDEGSLVPVSALLPGGLAVVRRVEGGRGLIQRLSAMGVLPGVLLKLVRGIGPVIVEVKGARMVLGRGAVSRILVKPVDGESAP
jgi:ferrous iron transport protein A